MQTPERNPQADAQSIIDTVASGGVAVFPVDVGYAIVGNAEAAIARVFACKKRSYEKACGMFSNRDMLVNLVQRAGHRDVTPLGAPGDLPRLIWQAARPGDVVVCLGAGNITAWAHALPGQIQQLAAEQAGPRPIANANDPGSAA